MVRLIIVSLFIMSIFNLFSVEVEAAPVAVSVCGEGTNESQASEDARKKAVQKVLMQILQTNNKSDSIFQKILSNYNNFAAKLEVSKKQKNGSTLYLFGRVNVDPDKIRDAIKPGANANNDNNVAYFFIRVQGISDSTKISKYQQRIKQVGCDTFQRLGFKTAVADELAGELNRLQSASYENFCSSLLAKIKQDYPEVTVAVIGEIIVTNAGEDSAGFTREGVVRIKAISFLSNSQAINFNESYRLKRPTADEADLMIIEKAAVNSTETLASKFINR
ncbi:MAG: hypothetical protein IJ728_05460 [Selenomonadaceae bacterium]|nr:hypothetical protein [Selenomonadaceae bacterium]